MNATVPVIQTEAPRPAAKKTLADFRLIPRIETFPRCVSFAQTWTGKVILLAAFGLGLRFFDPYPAVLRLVLPLALITFLPEYRRFVLALAPLCLLVVQLGDSPLIIGMQLVTVAAGLLLFVCARRWPNSLFGQRPVAFLLAGFTALIFSACAAAPGTAAYRVLWALVGALAIYVWFIGYALMDRNATPRADTALELASFRPLWGSTTTPFPKGAAYLRRIEAPDEQQLAIVQLKGLKLLVWGILLSLFKDLGTKFFYGYLRIPTSAQALAMSVHGAPAAWHLRWESQVLFFCEVTLSFAILGARFISGCRMAGFNALRNSYRPLSSRTIAEFFNRFYYYFKELLVDFFFYPTFLRYWKGHKRLRMTVATFVAVAFGNSFYHLVRDWQFFQKDGFWKGLASYQVLFFYNVIMATGLSISQLRKRGPRPKGLVRGHLLPVFGVLFFYCVLSVFGGEDRLYPLAVHLKYLASLFFMHF